MKLEEAIY